MADRPHPHQVRVHPQHRYGGGDGKSAFPQKGPSASKVLAVLALLPVGGSLLGLSGITLVGSLIGLAVVTPLFIIFSPVLIPAAITASLAVTGFIMSDDFRLTGLTLLSWMMNYFRRASAAMPQRLEAAKKSMQDVAVQTGQKTKEEAEMIQK